MDTFRVSNIKKRMRGRTKSKSTPTSVEELNNTLNREDIRYGLSEDEYIPYLNEANVDSPDEVLSDSRLSVGKSKDKNLPERKYRTSRIRKSSSKGKMPELVKNCDNLKNSSGSCGSVVGTSTPVNRKGYTIPMLDAGIVNFKKNLRDYSTLHLNSLLNKLNSQDSLTKKLNLSETSNNSKMNSKQNSFESTSSEEGPPLSTASVLSPSELQTVVSPVGSTVGSTVSQQSNDLDHGKLPSAIKHDERRILTSSPSFKSRVAAKFNERAAKKRNTKKDKNLGRTEFYTQLSGSASTGINN